LQPGFYWLTFLSLANGTTPNFAGPPSNGRGIGFPWYTEFSATGTASTFMRGSPGATELRATEIIQAPDSFTRPCPFLVV
jgi:hypothetical protein